MSNRYRIKHQDGVYFLTMTVHKWVDVFTRPKYKNTVLESFKYCQQNLGLKLHAYVIMTNHIHLIASVKSGTNLSSFINSFKSHVAKQLIKELRNKKESRKWILDILKKEDGSIQFWKKSNHPIILYSDKVANQKIQYIHMNPVKAGIVDFSYQYKYSSAPFYEKRNCELIQLEPIFWK